MHIFGARTLPCQNFKCNTEIPLISQFWLSKKKNKKVAFFPCEKGGNIAFQIVGTGYEPIPADFDPSKGTVTRGIVTCPLCKNTIPSKETFRLFQEGATAEKILVVVTQHHNISGKRYRIAKNEDMDIFSSAQSLLSEKRQYLYEDWGIDPVPDEPTPDGIGKAVAVTIRNCNLNSFGMLFNSRQQLFLITIVEKIRNIYPEILKQIDDLDYTKAIMTYFGLWLDHIADNTSNLCIWHNSAETIGHVFGMQTLRMAWDYVEVNTIQKSHDRLQTLLKPIKHLSTMNAVPATVSLASATNIPYPDNMFDAVLTDPPYYNNILYSHLSDFFYVWLKRSLGGIYPDLLSDQLTSKEDEIVAYHNFEGGKEAAKQFFEEKLSESFQEIHRVLKDGGIAEVLPFIQTKI